MSPEPHRMRGSRARRRFNQQDPRPRVLIISHLYPREDNPAAGVFVRRYAKALSLIADVTVVNVTLCATGQRASKGVTVRSSEGIFEVLLERAAPRPGGWFPRLRGLWFATGGVIIAELLGVWIAVRNRGVPSVVNPHFTYPSAITASLLRFLGWRYVVTEHSTEYLSDRFGHRGRLIKRLMRYALRHAATVAVVGEPLARAMESHGLDFRWTVVPNVIETCELRERPTTGPSRIVSISLMRDRAKNISGLLRAIAKLRSARSDFVLDLVGDGVDRESLEALAAELGVEDIVVFRGMQSESQVRDSLANSAFLVTNSVVETFSVVAAEALACGRPVVATRCGGPETFVNDEVGMLIDPSDEGQLVAALDLMLDRYITYSPARLRDYAAARFSPEAVAKGFSDALRDAGIAL